MGSKLNILHVIEKFRVGGAERHTVDLINGLNKNKFRSIVCCISDKGPLFKELKGFKSHIFKKKKRFDLSILFKLYNIIKKEKIDIIHTQDVLSHQYASIANLFVNRPVFVSTRHGFRNFGKDKLRKRDFIILHLLSFLVDKVISVSKKGACYYHKKEGIPFRKIKVIYNGVYIENFKKGNGGKIRQEFNFNDTDFVVGFIGRLNTVKNLQCLLKSASIVHEKNKNVKFLIVGDGPLESKLKKIANRLELKNTIFAGLREDIPDILSAIDVLALTSRSEACPIVFLESMAAGKPIISTNVGGVQEIVKDGINGFLVKPGDAEDFAEKISILLTEKEICDSMGEKGAKIVEHFSIDNFIKAHETLYIILTQKRKR